MPESPYSIYLEATDNMSKVLEHHNATEELKAQYMAALDAAIEVYKNTENAGGPWK